ncbi:uncharacterized protein LOC127012204 isoform X1 [Drosophila biarmipes]|uniref:uncharacterized protein LOC127012204 isoform X1 n=1 Tax=Drosophila biarmipes TaxID=125945 RepID=UPI0021CCE4B0|nr:uncharacterized protein LOC127012204 isoform X1 [Drosophila biarmipes]
MARQSRHDDGRRGDTGTALRFELPQIIHRLSRDLITMTSVAAPKMTKTPTTPPSPRHKEQESVAHNSDSNPPKVTMKYHHHSFAPRSQPFPNQDFRKRQIDNEI